MNRMNRVTGSNVVVAAIVGASVVALAGCGFRFDRLNGLKPGDNLELRSTF